MGCFSFMCKVTGDAVLSSSFDGDQVHLFLLKNGKVIEYMYGNYDSYGHVFDGKGGSFHWDMECGDVCDLMFDKDKSNGIAAILGPFWKEGDILPTERSANDPNQGWGDRGELMGSTAKDIDATVEEPVHKVY